MKKATPRFVIAYGALIIIGICVVAALLLYFPQRVKAVYSRPLVLIHNPINNDQVEVGEGISVHATARNYKGITRMELWIDDVLVHAKEAPEEGINPQILLSNWQPTTTGKHRLIVRAFSTDKIDGQSSITIEAVEAELVLEEYSVEVGDTLESIAEEHGISTGELAEINPGLPSGGPAPGASVNVPTGGNLGPGDPSEPANMHESSPAEESSTNVAPTPDDMAPGGFLETLGFVLGIESFDFIDPEAGEPRMLQIEVLSFETQGKRTISLDNKA